MSEEKIDFEKTLSELEKVISKLENGECSLEESIELFEKGMKYTAQCREALDNAQKRIIKLSESERSVNSDD